VQQPFWKSWQFWQIVVTATGALLGFLAGTLIKYALDRRRDQRLEAAAARTLATALHAEVSAIHTRAVRLLGLFGQSSGAPPAAHKLGQAIGIPKAIVFERNADRLGLLPLPLCTYLVQFFGIRSEAEGLLDVADPEQRRDLLAWLLDLANTAPQPLMALDEFLGRPVRDYGTASVAEVADLPVRNVPSQRDGSAN
jgi:hypothetical protein